MLVRSLSNRGRKGDASSQTLPFRVVAGQAFKHRCPGQGVAHGNVRRPQKRTADRPIGVGVAAGADGLAQCFLDGGPNGRSRNAFWNAIRTQPCWLMKSPEPSPARARASAARSVAALGSGIAWLWHRCLRRCDDGWEQAGKDCVHGKLRRLYRSR